MPAASETASSKTPFFIDTHCHLDAAEFDADRDAEYARAVAAGVAIQIVPAISRDSFAAVAATCARYPGCLPAWGLHPMFIHVHRPRTSSSCARRSRRSGRWRSAKSDSTCLSKDSTTPARNFSTSSS